MQFIFQSLSALRLVYVLTKPCDINRNRVLSLLQLARIRDAKKVIIYKY